MVKIRKSCKKIDRHTTNYYMLKGLTFQNVGLSDSQTDKPLLETIV